MHNHRVVYPVRCCFSFNVSCFAVSAVFEQACDIYTSCSVPADWRRRPGRPGPHGALATLGCELVVISRMHTKIGSNKCFKIVCCSLFPQIGVVGLGGLGHMAVKFLAALGCEPVVISRSDAKKAEAIALGAKGYLVSSDAEAMKAAAGRLLLCY